MHCDCCWKCRAEKLLHQSSMLPFLSKFRPAWERRTCTLGDMHTVPEALFSLPHCTLQQGQLSAWMLMNFPQQLEFRGSKHIVPCWEAAQESFHTTPSFPLKLGPGVPNSADPSPHGGAHGYPHMIHVEETAKPSSRVSGPKESDGAAPSGNGD